MNQSRTAASRSDPALQSVVRSIKLCLFGAGGNPPGVRFTGRYLSGPWRSIPAVRGCLSLLQFLSKALHANRLAEHPCDCQRTPNERHSANTRTASRITARLRIFPIQHSSVRAYWNHSTADRIKSTDHWPIFFSHGIWIGTELVMTLLQRLDRILCVRSFQ